MNLLAIDPGKSGGLALLTREGVAAITMPATHPDVVLALVECCVRCRGDGAAFVAVVELVTGARKGRPNPGSRMFNFGFGAGVVHGSLMASGVFPEIVPPRTWQAGLGLFRPAGEADRPWKNRLKGAAVRLFPALRVTLATADALLILAFRAGWTADHGPGPFRFPCS